MIRPLYNTIEALSRLLARASEVSVIAMTGVMVMALFLQIVSRYFFNSTIVWTEELALLMFTWIVFIGGSLGVRHRFHARLTFLLDGGGKYVNLLLERFTDILVAVFSVFLTMSGTNYVSETRGSFSAAAEYPLELLYVVAPVTGILMLFHSIAALLAPITFEKHNIQGESDNA